MPPVPQRQQVPMAATMIALLIVVAVAWLVDRGHVSGDAAIGLFSAIVGYVLGAANGSFRTSRRQRAGD